MNEWAEIHIDNLVVNAENDRHGQLGSEKEAIEWLLNHKMDDMKNLAKDIVNNGRIYEAPIVMEREDGRYVVYDGNRRITCLKLLLGKASADVEPSLYDKIRSLYDDKKPLQPVISCRVEEDINVVNKLLELNHIPGQSGAGRVNWDAHQKEAFYERTRQDSKVKYVRKINKILIEEGYLSESDRIHLSIFERLFSNKKFRERVGFRVENNEVAILKDKGEVLKALTYISKDIIDGRKTLNDFWNMQTKETYFKELDAEGILPSPSSTLPVPEPLKPSSMANFPSVKRRRKLKPKQEPLFPQDFPAPKENKFFSKKFCWLFDEFRYLSLDRHLVSASVIFRSLLEIPTQSYMRKHYLSDTKSGKLANCIKKVAEHINKESSGAHKLNGTTMAVIKKLGSSKNFESINTLHKVVHDDMMLSAQDLQVQANNLGSYLRAIIDDLNES